MVGDWAHVFFCYIFLCGLGSIGCSSPTSISMGCLAKYLSGLVPLSQQLTFERGFCKFAWVSSNGINVDDGWPNNGWLLGVLNWMPKSYIE